MTHRPTEPFLDRARALEAAYLTSNDPEKQSGFGGGRDRWVDERSPLVEAIDGSGDFLDVGCANGLLAFDVVLWAAERGHTVVPHGIDLGAGLIDLARQRNPAHAVNFLVADAWNWMPDRQWQYVYSLLDLSPHDLRCEWLDRLFAWVAPTGRLIIGSYGNRSRGIEPDNPIEVLQMCGHEIAGSAIGGNAITRFAWIQRP